MCLYLRVMEKGKSMIQKNNNLWILVATILGSSMAFLDGSVVGIALPRLQLDLGASAASVQWVVESYSLLLGALILVGGSLGDLYGRKRIFASGIIIFTLASIWCGLAPTITQLIIARSIQGIGGALLTPGSLSLLRASIRADQRGKAIGTWAGFSAIALALGPVLGGWLVQNASWRWIFFLNVPLAVIVLLVLFVRVPESRSEGERYRLDWWGTILVTTGLGAIVYGLIDANTRSITDPIVLSCILGGIVLLIAFVFVESKVMNPILPLTLFRSRIFTATNVLTLLLYGGLGGAFYFLPFNLIGAQGYPATEAGAALLPFTLLSFALSRWSGGLVTRYGSKLPLVVGPAIAAVGFALFAVPGLGGSYWLTYFPAVMVLGIGMTITIAPLTTTVMGAVEDRYAGAASGVNNAVARVASLLTIALFGLFVSSTFNATFGSLLSTLHLTSLQMHALEAQQGKLVGIGIPESIQGTARVAVHHAIAESFLTGFRVAMLLGAGLALLSALCSLLFMKSPNEISSHRSELHLDDNRNTLTSVQHEQENTVVKLQG